MHAGSHVAAVGFLVVVTSLELEQTFNKLPNSQPVYVRFSTAAPLVFGAVCTRAGAYGETRLFLFLMIDLSFYDACLWLGSNFTTVNSTAFQI